MLGGTRFIGRAIVDELAAAGHDVLVVHRGQSEPDDLPDLPHLHADRMALVEVAAELASFGPEVVLDCAAFGAADADAVLGAFPTGGPRLVVLSSVDTYRAYGSLHAGVVTDAVPLDESSPVRSERFPYRGQMPGMDDDEKLEVEERWLGRGGTVCRLSMVFGEHDYQRREELILRRVRAGRREIPVGAGTATRRSRFGAAWHGTWPTRLPEPRIGRNRSTSRRTTRRLHVGVRRPRDGAAAARAAPSPSAAIWSGDQSTT